MDRSSAIFKKASKVFRKASGKSETEEPDYLKLPKQRNGARNVDVQDQAKPTSWRNSVEVPSDIGPNGSAKLIHHNRRASGLPVDSKPGAANSGYLEVGNPTRLTSLQPNKSINQQAPVTLTGLYTVVPLTWTAMEHASIQPAPPEPTSNSASWESHTQTTDPIVTATVFIPDDSSSTGGETKSKIALDCAIQIEYPLQYPSHCESMRALTLAFVLDNSAFSSRRTWNRIVEIVTEFLDRGFFVENDKVGIFATCPFAPQLSGNNSQSPERAWCHSWSVAEAMDAIQRIPLSTDTPDIADVNMAIYAAMDALTTEREKTHRQHPDFGHVLLFTANPTGVDLEWLRMLRENVFPVYTISLQALPWPHQIDHATTRSLNVPRAKLGLDRARKLLPSNIAPTTDVMKVAALINCIRTSSLPPIIRNMKVWLAVESITQGPILGYSAPLEGFMLPFMSPGESVSHNVSLDLGQLLSEMGHPIDEGESDTYNALRAHLNDHHHQLVIRMECMDPHSWRAKTKITEHVTLQGGRCRVGHYDELRPAHYLHKAINLIAKKTSEDHPTKTSASDLLKYPSEARSYHCKLMDELQLLAEEGDHRVKTQLHVPYRITGPPDASHMFAPAAAPPSKIPDQRDGYFDLETIGSSKCDWSRLRPPILGSDYETDDGLVPSPLRPRRRQDGGQEKVSDQARSGFYRLPSRTLSGLFTGESSARVYREDWPSFHENTPPRSLLRPTSVRTDHSQGSRTELSKEAQRSHGMQVHKPDSLKYFHVIW